MKKTLITIYGPTAVGKTKFSIDLAKLLKCEIISCDSRQFYKELSVGTAIPSPKELEAVKHHCIHNKSINEIYTIKEFQNEAFEIINKLFKIHNFIIIVGGSGLYMDSIINGLDEFPEIDKMVRDELNLKFQKFGIKYLQNKLEELDPVYYLKVDLNNHRRLIRALEVCISSKKPYSSFIGKKTNKNTFNILNFAIEMNRDELYDKINNRVDHMISQGLVEEVKSLINFKNTNALNTVGYKELFLYFEKKCSLAESISEIKKNTRRYAKRQMTWLNSKKNIKKINHTISAQEVKRTYLDFR